MLCACDLVILVLLPLFGAALVLPGQAVPGEVVQTGKDAGLLERPAPAAEILLSTSPDGNSDNHIAFSHNVVNFSIPCFDCSESEREAVENALFSFNVLSTDSACSATNETSVLLNGVDLPGTSEKLGNKQLGLGLFELHNTADTFHQSTLSSWAVSCLCLKPENSKECETQHVAQVLVFTMRNIGKSTHPGFTISYQQLDRPRILHISTFPDSIAADNIDRSRHWQSLPLLRTAKVPELGKGAEGKPPPLMLKSSPSESTSDPSAIDTAQGFGQQQSPLADHKPRTDHLEPIAPTNDVSQEPTDNLLEPVEELPHIPTSTIPSLSMQSSPQLSCFKQAVRIIGDKLKQFAQVTTKKAIGQSHYTPPMQLSLAGTAPAVKGLMSPTVMAPPAARTRDVTSAAMEEPSPPMAASNPAYQVEAEAAPALSTNDVPSQNQEFVYAFGVTSVVLLLIALSAYKFSHLFFNPRRSADRAATREERKRRCAYRRAARRQRIRDAIQIMKRKVIPQRNANIEETRDEKGLSVAPKEHSSLTNIRNELSAMMRTHYVIDSMISAEEGMISTDCPSGMQRVDRRDSTASRTFSEGSYSSFLPPYEIGEAGVSNGYVYTRSGIICTPDSSVIATSPRTSIYLRDSDSEKE